MEAIGHAVLFESDADEEALRIECAVTGSGALEIMQESDGPLTAWCFEESPHRVEMEVEPSSVLGLLSYFHLDDAGKLPDMLSVTYAGYDGGQRIRALMKRLELPYAVIEHPIVR